MVLYFQFSEHRRQLHYGLQVRDALKAAQRKLLVWDDAKSLRKISDEINSDYRLRDWAIDRLKSLAPGALPNPNQPEVVDE